MSDSRLVLVIDNELDHSEIVAALLGRRGYRTAVACDAALGLEMARRLAPDLILLDVMMPGVDGFTAAEELQVDARTKNVPIVFLSACGEVVEDTVMRWSSGYLRKPFHAVELYRAVEEALGGGAGVAAH